MRGPESADAASAAPTVSASIAAASLTPLPIPATFSPLPPPTDADIEQCRTSCDHTYYFCSAASDTDDCAPSWSSCRANCLRPAAQTDTQALPGVR